jgi:DnaJ-class molecular chaperone
MMAALSAWKSKGMDAKREPAKCSTCGGSGSAYPPGTVPIYEDGAHQEGGRCEACKGTGERAAQPVDLARARELAQSSGCLTANVELLKILGKWK